jgi:DNA polymerase
MAERGIPDIQQQIVAAFDWWRDAGVDCDFTDDPKNWIVDPAEAAAKAAPATPQFIVPKLAEPEIPKIEAASVPGELSAFAKWWLSEPLLDAGRVAGRVPPRGAAQAELMVIVPHPEVEDSETLLSGPQGRLLDAMLQAMGVAPDKAYVASALPRHTPHADWDALAASGMGIALAHHVNLVSPRRLLVFGTNVLPLLSNDLPNSPADLHQFNHEGARFALLVARELGALLERPRWKAGFWQRWLEWTSADAVGE